MLINATLARHSLASTQPLPRVLKCCSIIRAPAIIICPHHPASLAPRISLFLRGKSITHFVFMQVMTVTICYIIIKMCFIFILNSTWYSVHFKLDVVGMWRGAYRALAYHVRGPTSGVRFTHGVKLSWLGFESVPDCVGFPLNKFLWFSSKILFKTYFVVFSPCIDWTKGIGTFG